MNDVLERLRKTIREDMTLDTDTLATGACADFSAYTKLCGAIQGLAVAERHLLDLAEELRNDDDED